MVYPYGGTLLSNKRNELLLHTIIKMKHKIIVETDRRKEDILDVSTDVKFWEK